MYSPYKYVQDTVLLKKKRKTEAAHIGYNMFRFPHEYSGEGCTFLGTKKPKQDNQNRLLLHMPEG